MLTPVDDVLLVAGGTIAGVVGTAGGITSLIAYPLLLAVGLPPFAANVTNSVALVTLGPGAALGSRPELAGHRRWVLTWGLFTAVGGLVGAALLLTTPARLFGRVVPFLLIAAALALLLQKAVTSWLEEHERRVPPVLLPAGMFAVAIYDGYFGAGSGVMMLAVVLLLVEQHLPRANALKNILMAFPTVASSLAFVFLGPVHWFAALPLAVGLFAGAQVGPIVARHVPTTALRVAVALMGFGLAGWLLASARS